MNDTVDFIRICLCFPSLRLNIRVCWWGCDSMMVNNYIPERWIDNPNTIHPLCVRMFQEQTLKDMVSVPSDYLIV